MTSSVTPAAASCRQHARVAITEGDRDAQAGDVPAMPTAVLGEHVQPVWHIGRGQVEAVPAVADRCHAAQCRVRRAAHHDRDAPPSGRLGIDAHSLEPDELAVEAGDVAGPHPPHRTDVLVRARATPRERNAQRGELLGRPADADAEREPARRQDIQGCRLLGHDERVVLGQQQDAGRQPDALSVGRDEAQAQQRIEPVRVRRHRDPAVAGVRIARRRVVHHDDVLAAPQGREPGRIGGHGDGADDLGPAAGADAKGVQPDLEVAIDFGGLPSAVLTIWVTSCDVPRQPRRSIRQE